MVYRKPYATTLQRVETACKLENQLCDNWYLAVGIIMDEDDVCFDMIDSYILPWKPHLQYDMASHVPITCHVILIHLGYLTNLRTRR